MVEHGGFRPADPALRRQAEQEYRVNVGKAVGLWQNKSVGIMRKLNLYTRQVQDAVFEANKAFSPLAAADDTAAGR